MTSPFQQLRVVRQADPSAPPKKKHNYYSAKYGHMAAQFVQAWAKQGFVAQEISCTALGVQPATLCAQLRWGLEWLGDNADPEDRAFFNELVMTSHFRVSGFMVQATRRQVVTPFMRPLNACNAAELKASLLSWIASDPPNRAKWPAREVFWKLSDAEVAEFQKILTDNKGRYIGRVTPDNVTFVRFDQLDDAMTKGIIGT